MTKAEARKEATVVLKKDAGDYSMRSCWKCNGAHEHLKELSHPLCCFECGEWYFKGINITKK